MEKKLITVFGSTGAQGGGVVRAILNDPSGEFAVRAVTRDVNSAKAQELKAAGAEVVQGDIDDPDSIHRALKGAYGAFFVTFFWAHMQPEKEIAEARSYAEAASKAGLKHAIWSTLEDVREFVPLNDDRIPTLHGKYKVPHFDAKGESDKFFQELGVPTTFLRASFYWDNFIYFGAGPQRGENGNYQLSLPIADKKMAGIAAEDIGKIAYGIFKKPELIGKVVGAAGEHLTGTQMASAMSKEVGKEIKYNYVPPEIYRTFGFPGADDLGNMFQFYRDFEKECNEVRDIDRSRDLNPELQSFESWLKANGSLIPLN